MFRKFRHFYLILGTMVFLFGFFPSTIQANPKPAASEWYVGGGWGVSDIDEDEIEDDFESISGLSTISFDVDDDNAWRAFGGYQFTPALALELGYVDFNEFDFDGSDALGPFQGEEDINGFTLNAVGRKFISGGVFGLVKAGLFRWESNLSGPAGRVPTGDVDDHGGDFTWGVGLGYKLSPSMNVRAEWNRYNVEDIDADLISANFVYRFRTPKQPEDLSDELAAARQESREKDQTIQDLKDRIDELKMDVDEVDVQETQRGLILLLPNRVLFESGQAEITQEGRQTLQEVAKTLKDFPNKPIRVEGHTDTVPIQTARFPSNWELSSARANNVTKYLIEEHGINPQRLAAVAHGEYSPRVPNTSPENRRKNRRVEIVIMKGKWQEKQIER